MFDFARFYDLPDGEEKMKYLKKGIDEADKEQETALSLELRYLYIKESVFNGDCYKAVIMFPEYMALFDKHPAPNQDDILSFMTAFKWIIEDVKDFYQVSRKMAEDYFEEFRKRCERYGFSLRTYYMKKMNFYADIEPEKAKELHEKFRRSERDELSDCAACEMNQDICMEFIFGTEEKALSMLNEMKKKGISCAEVPEVTFGKCVEHFTKIGAISEAEHYADMVTPMIEGNDNFLMEMSHILLLRALTDTDKALKLFIRSIEYFVRSRNPKMRFYFADACARFFNALLKQECEEISMTLPRGFERYKKDNLYSVSELAEYFYGIASDLAEKFDDRNGNARYKDKLSFEYPDTPVKSLQLPCHSTVPRAPVVIGVPFKSPDSFPSPDDIYELIVNAPGMELQDTYMEEETNVLVFNVNDKKSGHPVQLQIWLSNIDSNIERFNSIHQIDNAGYEGFISDYGFMLILSAYSDVSPADELLLSLLKLAVELNDDNSPYILDLINYRLLSAEWAEITSDSDVSPLDNYLYRIHAFRAEEDYGFDLVTTGLACFGSRQLSVRNIEEENIGYAGRVMEQICSYITGIGNMPDENTEVPFGVIYNNESQVTFGWKLPSAVYDVCEEFEDKEFAVPYITFLKDGEAVNLLLNELTAEYAELFDFRTSARLNAKRYALSKATFKSVMASLSEGDILTAGFTADIPEKYSDEYGDSEDVFVRIISDGSSISAVIEEGIDGIPELSEGAEISLSGDEYVFFWRLEKSNGDYYFPDDAYLII